MTKHSKEMCDKHPGKEMFNLYDIFRDNGGKVYMVCPTCRIIAGFRTLK